MVIFALLIGAFEKVVLIFIVPMTCWTSTVGPEPPLVHVFPGECKSLARFCQPFPLSVQDVFPRVGDCLGVDELLTCKAESWFPPIFPRCCKPFAHFCFLDVSSDCIEGISCDFLTTKQLYHATTLVLGTRQGF